MSVKILYLGPISPLVAYLESEGNQVIQCSDKIDRESVKGASFDFLVSYSYRFILKRDVLELFWPDKAINLHIAFLPWNRGADPNFWSFAENTPKGVTIHFMDEGIDTGDIIAQKKVSFDEEETLKTSYEKLQIEIQNLFKEVWPLIANGGCHRLKQAPEGTFHYAKDKEPYAHLLRLGWDTPVNDIAGYLAS